MATIISQPQTFILIGRSGSGKGTQADLLAKYLAMEDPHRKSIRIALGSHVRAFIGQTGFTSARAREDNRQGKLLPEFLTTWMWANDLVDSFTGAEHLIFDGTPRKRNEAGVLDDALITFYNRHKPYVILLNISEDVARERLEKRGRADDKTPGDIERRMAWYLEEVEQTIAFYRGNPHYSVIDIDGNQSVEKIHADILSCLTLS